MVASRSRACLYLRGDQATLKAILEGSAYSALGLGFHLVPDCQGPTAPSTHKTHARPLSRGVYWRFPHCQLLLRGPPTLVTHQCTANQDSEAGERADTSCLPLNAQTHKEGAGPQGKRANHGLAAAEGWRLEVVNCAPALPRWRPLRMMVVPEKWLQGTDGGSIWVFLRLCLW